VEMGDSIELLSGWYCPYAQRAWMSLEEKCQGKYKVTEAMDLDIKNGKFIKSEQLREKSPNKAQVPVVIHGDNVVHESLVCVEYIDEAFGNSTLVPGSPSQRAMARMWAKRLDNEIATNFYRLLMSQDKEDQKKIAQSMLDVIRDFSENIQGPFFFGEMISIVDICIAPWLVGYRYDVMKSLRQFVVPEGEEKFWIWSLAMSKHPSWVATISRDLAAMMEVYQPYVRGAGYKS